MERIERSDSEWRMVLTPEQYGVLRDGVTETPFSTDLDDAEQTGTYVCAGCRAELFDSDARYESEFMKSLLNPGRNHAAPLLGQPFCAESLPPRRRTMS